MVLERLFPFHLCYQTYSVCIDLAIMYPTRYRKQNVGFGELIFTLSEPADEQRPSMSGFKPNKEFRKWFWKGCFLFTFATKPQCLHRFSHNVPYSISKTKCRL